MFDTDQAADLAKAGADVLVSHIGTIGAQTTITLQDAALSVQGMHDAVKKVNPDSGAADTYISTAICIHRYRIKCPCADPAPVSHDAVAVLAGAHSAACGNVGNSEVAGSYGTGLMKDSRPRRGHAGHAHDRAP